MSDTITVYRCAECGVTDTSIGGIHGHIEKHRPVTRFYSIGNPEFLYELTERYEIPVEDADEYRTDPRDGATESIADRMERRARHAAAQRLKDGEDR
ncbi:hypothetical protein [Halostella pelagica]|uniref:hypothetical protein n=1 Tax=Halostella pelagica TaxID=2583824 RepID=UPI00108184F9|nr:hypothetical protein [Halostella pelagica]